MLIIGMKTNNYLIVRMGPFTKVFPNKQFGDWLNTVYNSVIKCMLFLVLLTWMMSVRCWKIIDNSNNRLTIKKKLL